MTGWSALTWNIARAGGFTSYALLTASVVLGIALSLRMQTPRWPRIINYELHNFVTLLSLVFMGVHILAVWIDPFTRFQWYEVFLPLASHYRTFWVALGIVGFYLALAVAISTLLRGVIGYAWWRRLHYLTFAIYVLATIHGIATGSDTRTAWGIAIYAASTLLVSALIAIRLLSPVGQGKAHPAIAGFAAVGLFLVAFWMVTGPLQPGWNAIANNGQGSGGVVAQAQTNAGQPAAAQSGDPFGAGFTAQLQGTFTQSGPDSNGIETFQWNTQLSGGAQGDLLVMLQRQLGGGDDDGGGAIVTINKVLLETSTTAGVQYQGQLVRLRSDQMVALLTSTASQSNQIQLRVAWQATPDGNVTGTVQGVPVSAG